MSTSLAERTVDRLRTKYDMALPEGTLVRRTFASASARNAGAWSWYLVDGSGRELRIGSQYSLHELLKCQNWSIDQAGGWRSRRGDDTDIDPCKECS